MKKKYNLSKIMTRAWVIYRKHNHKLSWSDSLKQSWSIAKNGVKEVDFNHVYNKYYTQTLIYITSRIRSKEQAEEITNDVFVNISNYLDSGKYDVQKASINTLLHTFVKNAIIDYWRKGKSNVVHTDGYIGDDGNSVFDFMDENPDVFEQKELHEQVMSALETLNENEKSVVKMFHLENYSQNEISEILGLSVANVKQIVYRTKDKLQDVLKGVYSLME